MFSFTCSLQPSSLMSNGSKRLFKNSIPLIQAMSILPWNFTEFCFVFSSIIISYSPCISASGESIVYFLVKFTPFASNPSNFRRYLNFSLNNSSLVICGCCGTTFSGFTGISLNLANPSQVLFSFSFPEPCDAVDCPKPGESSKRTLIGLESSLSFLFKVNPFENKSERLS